MTYDPNHEDYDPYKHGTRIAVLALGSFFAVGAVMVGAILLHCAGVI